MHNDIYTVKVDLLICYFKFGRAKFKFTEMIVFSFLLAGLFLIACNAQAKNQTIEETLNALLLALDSGGRRIEQLGVDSKLLCYK